MDILRITAVWSGFSGGPGYSNFHFTTDGGFWDGGLIGNEAEQAAQAAADRVGAAFTQLSSYLPGSARVDIETEAAILDSDSGEILGSVDVDTPGASATGSANVYAGPAGAIVNWRTADYRNGRRIRGRTFLVPLAIEAYQDDGTLSSPGRLAVQNFGDEMFNGSGGPELGVWSRPINGAGGVFATVTGFNVPDMVAVLRSRRD